MTKFIETPNLPSKKVSLAICGNISENISRFIKKQGIELFFSDNNKYLDSRVSAHCDMNVHHLGAEKILLDTSQEKLAETLSKIKMRLSFSTQPVRSPYSTECIFNCFEIGDYLFCKLGNTDEKIIKYAISRNKKIVNVKQGYCKCSTLILTNNSFITDDDGIYLKGKENSLDCLKINKGDILLNGYKYGFIGGASAMIDKNTVLFFGDVTKHSSFNQIDTFLKGRNIKYIYTNEFMLTDIGGIIPIM